MPNLNTRILFGVSFALPSIDEQRDIAAVLTACDAKIATLEAEAALYDELFRTVLDELLSGRISTRPLIEPPDEGFAR